MHVLSSSIHGCSMIVIKRLLLLCTLLATGFAALAQQTTSDESDSLCYFEEDCVDIGNWDIGLAFGWGRKTNPVRNNNDIPLYIVPSITYYGESWYFDNGNIGYTLAEEENYTFNLTTSYSADPFYFMKSSAAGLFYSGFVVRDEDDEIHFLEFADEFNELENRHFTLFGGVEFFIFTQAGIIKLAAAKDLFGVHHGTQAEAQWSYYVNYDRWNFELTLGLDWKSKEVIQYYYGVRPSENLFWSFVYRPHAGFNQRVEGRIRYNINEQWDFLLLAQHTKLSDEIANSPILFESYSNTLFIGATYRF